MSRDVTFRHDPAGWRQFVQSQMVGDAMESVARDIAAEANAQGTSEYHARQVTDIGGKENAPRAGAEVYTDASTVDDAMQRKLISVSYAYRMKDLG